MALKGCPAALSVVFIALLFTSAATAHNITRLLSDNPDFSSFNSLLTETDLADEINRRHTITVLAVSNDEIGAISGFSLEVQRRVLSVHVVLDYYDLDKLRNLNKRSTILTTLFQTTGIANGSTGFLNMTKFSEGRIAFGSATAGAGLDADLEGSVAARPFNISVLQVSSIIIPPGIDEQIQNSPPPPASAKAPEPAKANETAPSKAPAPAVGAPVTDVAAPAPAADAPVAEAAPADAPVADAPAEAPEADSPSGEVDEEVKSGVERLLIGASLSGVMGAVLLAYL